MPRGTLSILLATLLLTAGCTTITGDGSQQSPETVTRDITETRSATPAGTPTATPAPTASPSPTATPTPTPVPPDNPWHASTIHVRVLKPDNDSRNYTPLVESALEYWEENAPKYTNYTEVDYQFTDGYNPRSDLRIKFVDTVDSCGYVITTAETLGCAPTLVKGGSPYGIKTVFVITGLADDSTIYTVKHELGHTLGLSHNTSPMPLMAPYSSNAREIPVKNATERTFAYADRNITVSIDIASDSYEEAAVREHFDRAVMFHESSSSARHDNRPNITLVEDESDADVEITITDQGECGFDRGGFCGFYAYGEQLDSDPAYELYTDSGFTLAGIDETDLDWWMARGLSFSFGTPSHEELPHVLKDQKNKDRSYWGL